MVTHCAAACLRTFAIASCPVRSRTTSVAAASCLPGPAVSNVALMPSQAPAPRRLQVARLEVGRREPADEDESLRQILPGCLRGQLQLRLRRARRLREL